MLYRQFVESGDYDFAVISDHEVVHEQSYRHLWLTHPGWLGRLLRSRLSLWAWDFVHLFAGKRVKPEVMTFAKLFNPDLILVGAETWLADLGITLGRKLKVPVAGYFMDWPSYGTLGHDWLLGRMGGIFRRRYQSCDLAFGICPEMLEALGSHHNAVLIYPIGKTATCAEPAIRALEPGNPLRVTFSGNLGQWYGRQLQRLYTLLADEQGIALRISGRFQSWDDPTQSAMEREGVYLGYLSRADMEANLRQTDVLLVIMGFDASAQAVESTSFKSKMVDYLPLGIPLLVWGPDYCTAVKHAQKYGFAEVVTEDNPALVVEKLIQMSEDVEARRSMALAGQNFYQSELHPSVLLERAKQAITDCIAKNRSSR